MTTLLVAGTTAWIVGTGAEALDLARNENPAWVEAQAIRQGSVVLPRRTHDTAPLEGGARNIFPPGQTLFYLLTTSLWSEPDVVRRFPAVLWMVFLATVAVVWLVVFRLSGGRPVFTSLLTLATLCGAPYLPSYQTALTGSVTRVTHCFAILLTMLALVACSRKSSPERLWLAGLPIAAAMLFRTQNVLLAAYPALLLLSEKGRILPRLRQAAGLAAPIAVAMGLVMTFQAARFGNPFELGYERIYEGRRDALSRRARSGVFSHVYLADNLHHTFLNHPRLESTEERGLEVKGDPWGNSLPFSQPWVLLLLIGVPALADPRTRALAITAVLMAGPSMFYHNTGYRAVGYPRYSLDYIVVWAVLLTMMTHAAPLRRTATWLMAPITFWSLFYAGLLVRDP